MSVNMTSLWELITEVTDHTEQLVDLVILGVVITVVFAVGALVIGCITGDSGYKPSSTGLGSDSVGGRKAFFMHRR